MSAAIVWEGLARLARAANDTVWEAIVFLIRAYSRRKYGREPDGLTIHIPGRPPHYESFPDAASLPLTTPAALCPSAVLAPVRFGQGTTPQFRNDGRLVYWPGRGVFDLNDRQAKVALCLWKAKQEGVPYVRGEKLLAEAGSSAVKMSTLFEGCPAWKKLILPVEGVSGAYQLPPLPEESQEPDTRIIEREGLSDEESTEE